MFHIISILYYFHFNFYHIHSYQDPFTLIYKILRINFYILVLHTSSHITSHTDSWTATLIRSPITGFAATTDASVFLPCLQYQSFLLGIQMNSAMIVNVLDCGVCWWFIVVTIPRRWCLLVRHCGNRTRLKKTYWRLQDY